MLGEEMIDDCMIRSINQTKQHSDQNDDQSDGDGKGGELDISEPNRHIRFLLQNLLEVNAREAGQKTGDDDGDEAQNWTLARVFVRH